MEILIAIALFLLGAYIGWRIARHYYLKSSEDMQELASEVVSSREKQSFHDVVETILNSDPETDWKVTFKQGNPSLHTAAYLPDLRIHVDTTYFVHSNEFVEKWANKHPDPNAKSYYYHIYFGTTIVRELILVSVDGGRAELPLPIVGTNEVTALDYKVAQIFDSIHTVDEYIYRSGLKVSESKDF